MDEQQTELEKTNKELEKENDVIETALNNILESVNKNTTHIEGIKKYAGEKATTLLNINAKRLFLKIQKSLTKSQENNLTTTQLILKAKEEGKIYNFLYQITEDDDEKKQEQTPDKLQSTSWQ